jgi:putative tryptophan/tyrosine transport system substrate-binding protein
MAIGRRQFISALGAAAVVCPLAARAQQVVIGFLHPGLAEINANRNQVAGFREGLRQTGYVEGQNVVIEYRWGNDQYDRMPALATELVRRQVAAIAALTPVAALAAKQATTSIPIVFALGSDPVKLDLVASLNRPGGNITGATFLNNVLDAKRLDLLHQIVPNAKLIAMLVNPKNPNADSEKLDTQAAARSLGLEVVVLQASTEQEVDASIASLTQQGAHALFVAGDAFLNNHGETIAKLAMQHALPTCFINREQAAAGALMSYGASLADTSRQAGNYVGRILKGEKPADLPVQQPTKFEFVINMKTAKALGLTVPQSMLLLADEIIE